MAPFLHGLLGMAAALSAGNVKRLGAGEVNAYARVDNLFDWRHAGLVIVNERNGRYYELALGRGLGVGRGRLTGIEAGGREWAAQARAPGNVGR